ncbi:DUF202 domain-containing protein [Pseudoclavibacter sp. RFBJ3]|uniref:DUF202 domain-containing protein n=1 Tax=unclassified Pseudoclavibacter TaxID=2615177 RepID=UPI000CE733E6|nr:MULTISPECIES: DUF202 domain-containing protein [unclassified Pseudoclavibacter]PPF87513.1 DUF202 domain-containing protein [Pseudoclavibacter sp. RFBJ5]PPF90363.1 DUF202 domain-containing protein [Pseudoclavibacter sp. RFBJ3]PPG01048.1 DUF202 domain-containing protein [Pseudoclavibacter sp. RFBH5]PPG26151.1 DUF202 domain-containing protein [Pseudoclavibacter sp. RFBI4]
MKVFDVGLQPERTLLAWQRTCLALAVAFAVALRLATPVMGAAAIAACAGGLVLVASGWVAASHRYRRNHHDLIGPSGALSTTALPVVLLAVSSVLIATLGIVFVALLGLSPQ